MTAKEKAQEIFDFYAEIDDSKESAMFCVEQIEKALNQNVDNLDPEYIYWQQVKTELKNI